MTRRSKEITIGDRPIAVYEIRVRDALDYLRALEDDELSLAKLRMITEQFFPRLIGGLRPEDLADLYPSELEALWTAFREVNAPFFKAARTLGLDAAADRAAEAGRRIWSGLFSDWWSGVTAPASGSTAGAASWPPSTRPKPRSSPASRASPARSDSDATPTSGSGEGS